MPGYYYQEISAKRFVLLGGNYLVPLDKKQRWNLDAMAATAVVDYLPGLEQPGHWHSGVGGGIHRTPTETGLRAPERKRSPTPGAACVEGRHRG